MKQHRRGWQAHEADIARLLGLSQTISSGNKFHDPGDGIDRSHPSLNSFALIADCKCTERASFSVKLQDLSDWRNKAFEMGKRFVMPIRFEKAGRSVDYILLGLDDFMELLESSRGER